MRILKGKNRRYIEVNIKIVYFMIRCSCISVFRSSGVRRFRYTRKRSDFQVSGSLVRRRLCRCCRMDKFQC